MKLLHICAHEELSAVRGWYMRTLGFDVTNALSLKQAIELFSEQEFRTVVLCHTLSRLEKQSIEELIDRHCAESHLIELYSVESPVTSGIPIEAAQEFQSFMTRWSECLAEPVSNSSGAKFRSSLAQHNATSTAN